MSSGRKCKNCGSSDIEVDPGRGDAVCTNCGSVLEDSIIVSEVQFEEGAHGSSSAIGQFVSVDSKGGATKFGASFHLGTGIESREITLKKARNGIQQLCNQLQLNQHCIDTACSFFKMALSRNLTRGRKNTHVHAACVYLTCRTEGTAHLLIDISDVLQICCYELGRVYLKLSQALCINIPSVDPCLYIMRFAAKLEFGPKTQQVVNTALRLVQRMKRDSIHSGRRPSGLCGAALLIASRLHEFNRTAGDIVKIVKVHESTLRKRLIEFGDTPSSALTLEEFMTVDLEEEQDPPSFKAARKRDKERLQKVFDTEADKITQFQKEIETQLERDGKNRRLATKVNVTSKELQEQQETVRFIQESTMGAIQQIIQSDEPEEPVESVPVTGLGPNIESMGLANSLDDTSNVLTTNTPADEDLTFDDIDDKELDTYIMSETEALTKKGLWHKRNADYLKMQEDKEEKLRKEREEGRPEKKRKRVQRKRNMGPASSAGEAIEKILQEKKISAKINYDVLKSLNAPPLVQSNPVIEEDVAPTTSESIRRRRLSSLSNFLEQSPSKVKKGTVNLNAGRRGKEKPGFGLPFMETEAASPVKEKEVPTMSEEELDEDYEEDANEAPATEMGVLQMLREHNQDATEDGEEYFGYDGEDY